MLQPHLKSELILTVSLAWQRTTTTTSPVCKLGSKSNKFLREQMEASLFVLSARRTCHDALNLPGVVLTHGPQRVPLVN